MTKSKFVTIAATKRIGLLIVSCPLEYKHYKVGDELREFNNISIQPEQRL